MTLDEAIQELRGGNQDAFTHIYRLFFSKFRNYFHHYTGRYDIAEELANDVFLKLWLYHSQLPDIQNMESYLFIMSRNELFNHLKKQKKEAMVYQRVTDKQEVVLDPAVQEVYKQAMNEYQLCLNQLDAEHKKIFLLSREEGLTYAQIATYMGMSVKMVKRRMEHTLRLMRTQMQPLCLIALHLLILA